MKNVILFLLSVYQKIVSPLLHQLLGVKSACRHTPTCTIYAKQVFEQYGAAKGSLLTLQRLLNCQPFFIIRFKSTI